MATLDDNVELSVIVYLRGVSEALAAPVEF